MRDPSIGRWLLGLVSKVEVGLCRCARYLRRGEVARRALLKDAQHEAELHTWFPDTCDGAAERERVHHDVGLCESLRFGGPCGVLE